MAFSGSKIGDSESDSGRKLDNESGVPSKMGTASIALRLQSVSDFAKCVVRGPEDECVGPMLHMLGLVERYNQCDRRKVQALGADRDSVRSFSRDLYERRIAARSIYSFVPRCLSYRTE